MSESKLSSIAPFHLLILVALVSVPLFLFYQPTKAAEAKNQFATFFNRIAHYAELSNIAYREEQVIKKVLSSHGEDLIHYGSVPELQIQYFLAINRHTKIQSIAIRGTTTLDNALTGFDLKLTKNAVTGTRIHNGFSRAATAVLNQLEPLLDKSYKIVLTGHSLGGAVAQVLAMYLDVKNFSIERVITFGQPKVTNITGVLKFRYLNIIRVVTPQDMVPLIPPLDPMDINDLDIYWHAGQEVILLGNKQFSLTSGIESMLRATKILDDRFGEKNLTLHQMSEYLNLVGKMQVNPEKIPYKNDYSGVKSLLGL